MGAGILYTQSPQMLEMSYMLAEKLIKYKHGYDHNRNIPNTTK